MMSLHREPVTAGRVSLAILVLMLSCLLWPGLGWGQGVAVLEGAAAKRFGAEAGDTSGPNTIRTGKETIEWELPAVPAGLYCFEMRARCGNADDEPQNLVGLYRVSAVTGEGVATPAIGFELKPGTKVVKTSEQWPEYKGDVVSTAALSLRAGMRLRVTSSGSWATVDQVRIVQAPDRFRLSVGLDVAQPHALFRRGEPIQAVVTAKSYWDVPVKVPVRVELISPYGKPAGEMSLTMDVPANGSAQQAVTFPATLNGCYILRLHTSIQPRSDGVAFEYAAERPVGVVAVPKTAQLPSASPFGLHPAELTELYDSGFRWVRLWDSGDVWAAHERGGKGKYDFGATEKKVENFRRQGFEVLAELAYTPTWASTHPEISYYTGNGSPFPPKDIHDWEDYCREYMTRFKGRIRYFEVWNEPNTGKIGDLNEGFFRGSVGDYIALLKSANRVSREVDPGIRILGGSGTGDFLEWTQTILDQGAGEYMDGLSFHAYTTPQSPEEAGLEGRLDRLHQIMEKHGVGKLPLWNTEVGYWTDRRIGARPATAEELVAKAPKGLAPNWMSNWPYRPITEEDAAAFTVRHYYLNMSRGVERLFWYTSATGGLPLLCEDGSLRLSCFAVASAADQLNGYTYWRSIDLGTKRLELHLWRNGDSVKGIAWYADRGTRDIRFASAAGASAVDIWGNDIELQRSGDGVLLQAGRDPITITAPAAFFDGARLQSAVLTVPVDDAYVVKQVSAERPVKDHTLPAYHGDRRVFGLPDAGDALGWKLPRIAAGRYDVEIELRTGYADNLYGDLDGYELSVIRGGAQTVLPMVPVEDRARQSVAITTKEGGNRAYGWARAREAVELEPGSEIRVTMKRG